MTVKAVASVSAGAQNTFTSWLPVAAGRRASMSISGTWSGVVHFQRTFDGGATPLDVESFTANGERTYVAEEGSSIRLGIKTGNYTSGTALLRVGTQGN